MNDETRLNTDAESRICSMCERAGSDCPYGPLSQPVFPCEDYLPLYHVPTPRKKGTTPSSKKAYQKQYYDKNKGRARAYYKAHKSDRQAYQKMYRELNREAIRLRDKKYNETKRKSNKS